MSYPETTCLSINVCTRGTSIFQIFLPFNLSFAVTSPPTQPFHSPLLQREEEARARKDDEERLKELEELESKKKKGKGKKKDG